MSRSLIWLARAGMRLFPVRFALKWPLGLIAFLGSILLIKSPLPGRFGFEALNDYIVAVGFCVALLSITHHPPSAGKALAIWGKRCAGFSYTLYACHFPLLVFLAAFANTRLNVELPMAATKIGTWVYYAVFLAVTTLACWSLSLITENKYHQLRNWLIHRLGWAKIQS